MTFAFMVVKISRVRPRIQIFSSSFGWKTQLFSNSKVTDKKHRTSSHSFIEHYQRLFILYFLFFILTDYQK